MKPFVLALLALLFCGGSARADERTHYELLKKFEARGDLETFRKSAGRYLDAYGGGLGSEEIEFKLILLQDDRIKISRGLTEFIDEYDESPRLGQAYLELGKLDYLYGSFKSALEHFRKAAARLEKEAQPEALFRQGQAYLQLDALDTARALFEKLSVDYPKSEYARRALLSVAQGYLKSRDFSSIPAYAERVAALPEASPEERGQALVLLYYAYSGLGNMEAAEQAMQTCFQVAPRSFAAREAAPMLGLSLVEKR